MELRGVIDLHVHAGPDLRPRKMNALELAHKVKASGMRGFLLKNHHVSTVVEADILRRAVPGLEIFGGLVLNNAVGGLNPAAVDAALKMGAAEIWMPTLDAQHERVFRGSPETGLSVFDADGRLLPAVREILKLIAERRIIVGLGHLSAPEMFAVIDAGRAAGVTKFLVTHPEIEFLNFSQAVQRELAGPGVYFERCYVRAISAVDWDGLAANVRALGVETTVLATDLGQPDNADPVEGMKEMLEELTKRGFTPQELEIMACRNPATLLGLD